MAKQKNRKTRNRHAVESTSDQEDSLYHTLPKAGLSVAPVASDGNCLFRAFASQYCGDEERHEEFRYACCEYMLYEEPEFFESFLDDQTLSEYVSELRKDGTWGTQLEIVSLCRRYHVNCVIFRPDGLHYRIESDSKEDDADRILILSHHDEEHFNEVRFKEKGRVLTSFNELELLLTELDDAPVKISKKQARRGKRQSESAARVDVSAQKFLDI